MSTDSREVIYQKLEAFHRNKQNTIFSDGYDVYLNKLFDLFYGTAGYNEETDLKYWALKNVLRDRFNDAKDFDADQIKHEVRTRMKKEPWSSFEFIFGIHVKLAGGAPFPIKRSKTINQIKFERKSFEYAKKINEGHFIKELTDHYSKHRYSLHHAESLLRNEYIFFRAKASGHDMNVAVNKIATAFQLFTAAASVAQERGKHTYIFGINTVKSRKPIRNPSLYYHVSPATKTNNDIFFSSDGDLEKPDTTLDFTKKKQRLDDFNAYMRILTSEAPTPIEKRIRLVLREFDNALNTKDDHLRMLNFWRCIEVTTQRSQGKSRTQEEMVDIIKTYFADDYWKEMGTAILKMRNNYVHQGEGMRYYNRDSMLSWIQSYASRALNILMMLRKYRIGLTADTEIDDFMDAYTKSQTSLKIASKLYEARKPQKT